MARLLLFASAACLFAWSAAADSVYTVAGPLPGQRETESNLNNPRLVDAVVDGARVEGVNAG